MAADLPQYSWGIDPSTGQWSYFMNKAGSQSADIGRKAGDKLASYQAPQNDAASIQQQALEHLLNAQVNATPATAAPAAAQNVVAPVAGSGIATALGHGASGHYDGSNNMDNGGAIGNYDGVLAALGNYGQAMPSTSISGHIASALSNFLASKNDGYSALSGANGYADARDAAARGFGVGNTDPNGTAEAASNQSPAESARLAAAAAESGSPTDTSPATQNQADANQSQAESARLAAAAAAAQGADGEGSGTPSSSGGTSEHSDTSSGESSSSTSGATGGLATAHAIRHFADGGQPAGLHAAASLPPRFVRGPGDGQSDSIPVRMSDGGQGHLADNEFVVPADAVSALGSGSSEAGARAMYDMVDRIRRTAHGHTQQANPVDPRKVMPV